MKIIETKIAESELAEIAKSTFGDMVKAVVDVGREVIAIDAELHSDIEAYLIQDGSKQENLWGINLYPGVAGEEFVEFDSLINIRPACGNKTRGVESEEVRKSILKIVTVKVER
ncbi:MAG: DUF5674 family protein [Elusimicrobiota bacterium]